MLGVLLVPSRQLALTRGRVTKLTEMDSHVLQYSLIYIKGASVAMPSMLLGFVSEMFMYSFLLLLQLSGQDTTAGVFQSLNL